MDRAGAFDRDLSPGIVGNLATDMLLSDSIADRTRLGLDAIAQAGLGRASAFDTNITAAAIAGDLALNDSVADRTLIYDRILESVRKEMAASAVQSVEPRCVWAGPNLNELGK